jgi:hypothetical protein
MNWLRSKAIVLSVAGLGAIILGYGFISMRNGLDHRMSSIEQEMQDRHTQDQSKIAQLTSDLSVLAGRMGVTAQELDKARKVADQLKEEHAKTAQRLRAELAAKADSRTVSQIRKEANEKLAEVQNDTTARFGTVSGEVQTVRVDLDTTRQDLESSRKDITDVRTLVARNGSELAELRRRGERDYLEFDIRKGKQFERIGDIQIQLKKTDTKRQKYNVVIQADDNRVEKKDRVANEPLQFLVGRDRLRYEVVVNFVDKDRIRGYVSTPKDKVLAAEGPTNKF